MTLPSAATKANSDQTSDDPELSILTDLAGVIDKFNLLLTHLGLSAITNDPLTIGQGLESATGTLRAKLQATSYLLRDANGLAVDTAKATGQAILGTRWRDANVNTKVAAYSITTSDVGDVVVLNKGTADTFTLPALATAGDGFVVHCFNLGAGTLTIDGSGAETVNGAANIALAQFEGATLVASNTNSDWHAFVGGGSGGGGGFASGVRMVFQQTAAPSGWTKDTNANKNDAAFRSTTGTVGVGGADLFNTLFGTSKSTASHTLVTAEIPVHAHGAGSYAAGSHRHGVRTGNAAGAGYDNGANVNILSRASGVNIWSTNTNSPQDASDEIATTAQAPSVSGTSGNAGSGTGHSHTLNNMDLKFVDLIVAEKD